MEIFLLYILQRYISLRKQQPLLARCATYLLPHLPHLHIPPPPQNSLSNRTTHVNNNSVFYDTISTKKIRE